MPSTDPPTFWRPREQETIAGMVLLGFVALVASWGWSIWRGDVPQEFERAVSEPIPFQVDLNTAAWPELAQLPGIGETVARRIVDDRQARGPFASVDDLQRVTGVGPKTLAALRPYASVSSPEATNANPSADCR